MILTQLFQDHCTVNKKNFFYEHIGHMQFSTLTLTVINVIERLTHGTVGFFVDWNLVRDEAVSKGFSERQVVGEMDRFCYGFECTERYTKDLAREISLTNTGRSFIDNLLREASYRSSQLAILMRPSRKKGYWNTVVQESTFFPKEVYENINKFNFRKGPARDFLKCLTHGDISKFLTLALENLSLTTLPEIHSLEECLRVVNSQGKYWASVGGRYSWFVFAQRFELPFDDHDWAAYDKLMIAMIRPPEWGGGIQCSFEELLLALESEGRIAEFREFGIIRPVRNPGNSNTVKFQLTAPGYLIWERKKKGFIYEFRFRRLSQNTFEIALCDASDFPGKLFPPEILSNKASPEFPSWIGTGDKSRILEIMGQITGG